MNRVVNRNSQGFTLVELLLAMAFISVLLIVIAVTVIQISNLYSKGQTMKAVDQAGRAISSDIRQTLSQSQPFSKATAFRERSYPGNDTGIPDGGRLCTGVYTYVWNTGKSLAETPSKPNGDPINKYSGSDTQIRFARVRDNGGEYCADQNKEIDQANATELLSAGDRNLSIQSFQIDEIPLPSSIGQALYHIQMEIGTNDQGSIGRNLDTMDITCKPPTADSALENYCAVNRFDFTAQAGNKGGQ